MGKRRDQSVETLIKVGVKCFNEDNFTILTVSKESGIPRANIFYYFKSKDGLYDACLQDCLKRSINHSLKMTIDDNINEVRRFLAKHFLNTNQLEDARDQLQELINAS